MKPKKAERYIALFKKYEEVYDDIYIEESTNNFVDDDSINSAEQGFMIGYLNA